MFATRILAIWLGWWPALLLAAVPQVQLSRSEAVVNLAPVLATEALPSYVVLDDPQRFWDSPVPASSLVPAQRWQLQTGHRLVGRVQLQGTRAQDEYVLVAASPNVDEVQIWYRVGEGGWKSQLAGDRIALAHWPFAGPYPAFPLPVGDQPVQLIVTAVNNGPLTLPVLIEPDARYREVQARQAQLSGLTLGLAMMSLVVCIISALAMRRAANWLLAGVAAWALVTTACLNGDLGLWVTPDTLGFNESSKHFTLVVLGALFTSVVALALDPHHATRFEHGMTFALAPAALAYAVAQWLWLPHGWRTAGTTAWTVGCVLLCALLCGLGALRGSRFVPLVAGASVCYALANAAVAMEFDLKSGLDLRSPIAAALLFAALMMIRHALFARERHGRDVLGRAAVSAHRDPLTALLSFSGFQQAYEAMLLQHKANGGSGAVMLFVLPAQEKSAMEHGYELLERALVRMAASLVKGFGEGWAIARLSKSRFAAVSIDAYTRDELRARATQMLAHCTRLNEPLAVVTDFDMRIAAAACHGDNTDVKELLRQLEDAALALETGKRIVIL